MCVIRKTKGVKQVNYVKDPFFDRPHSQLNYTNKLLKIPLKLYYIELSYRND